MITDSFYRFMRYDLYDHYIAIQFFVFSEHEAYHILHCKSLRVDFQPGDIAYEIMLSNMAFAWIPGR